MKIQALKVHQWLDQWKEVCFDEKRLRPEPDSHFYLLSLKAHDLRRLSGIYARSVQSRTRAADDFGIQRRHDANRSQEIGEFVRYGHPWAGLSKTQRVSGEYDNLKKPGWLPTAIVVNILKDGDKRAGKKIASKDVLQIGQTDSGATITLPAGFEKKTWAPTAIPPIEIIDGQHRLWAFDQSLDDDFEFPVVAFHGLGVSWQAYLFYVINIKPKRITASLAFDLYPLLRTEDWLEKFEGPVIYRETRAQELVDLFYSHRQSPWHKRINMLGESGVGRMVSQAAWVRSLLATCVKSWEGKRVSIGGLFGAPVGKHEQVLPWTRQEQAAFIIAAGDRFREAVKETNQKWAKTLREKEEENWFPEDDLAFYGAHTLIAQDQGVRAFLSVVNDICYLHADKLKLEEWGKSGNATGNDLELVTAAIKSMKSTPIYVFLDQLADHLAQFDWRASSAPGLSPQEALVKAAFRGSGGYRDLRHQLLLHLQSASLPLSAVAGEALKRLGYKH